MSNNSKKYGGWVLYTEVNGLRYYLQKQNGSYRLSGLINNAIEFESQEHAIAQIPSLQDRTGYDLKVMKH